MNAIELLLWLAVGLALIIIVPFGLVVIIGTVRALSARRPGPRRSPAHPVFSSRDRGES